MEPEAPVIRGFAFDKVHTRLFIRPNICDGLEASLSKGSGTAHGTFVVRNDTEREQRSSFDFKKFLLEKGERVGLWTAVGFMVLLLVFSLFMPGSGFLSGSQSANAEVLKKKVGKTGA